MMIRDLVYISVICCMLGALIAQRNAKIQAKVYAENNKCKQELMHLKYNPICVPPIEAIIRDWTGLE